MNYLIILFGVRSIFYVKICTCVSYITFFFVRLCKKIDGNTCREEYFTWRLNILKKKSNYITID